MDAWTVAVRLRLLERSCEKVGLITELTERENFRSIHYSEGQAHGRAGVGLGTGKGTLCL